MFPKAEKAFQYYQEGKNLNAIEIFKELVVEYPDSEYYGKNLYNIAAIYQEIDSLELAKLWFIKILEDDKLSDADKDNSRGIFETNANYKHYSAFNIGVISYNTNNYLEALKYYNLATTEYPYFNSSETDKKMNKIKLAINISDCYLKLEKIDNAIVSLLPHAVTASPKSNNLASEKLLYIIRKNKIRREFKKALDIALTNIEQIDKGLKLVIYNIEVRIYPYGNEKLNIDSIKETDFYKNL
jgi:tetratricopeptide (TPR) repeat protein